MAYDRDGILTLKSVLRVLMAWDPDSILTLKSVLRVLMAWAYSP